MTTALNSNGTPRTARDAARHYLRFGIFTVPVKPHDKRPWDFERNRLCEEWERLRVTDADIDRLFDADGNIGVLLGAPSGGLVDVDLDCPEARRAAPHLLPETDMVGGRESAPDSHHFFVVNDPPSKASDKFLDPCIGDRKRNTVLELRSTGGQTVVAPSVYGAEPDKGHPKPERFVWHRHGAAAKVSIDVLTTAVRGVAAAALLGRYWPTSSRHDAALALAGGLRRAGWLEESAVKLVTAICAAAEDREINNRVGCVRDTFARSDDEKITGWPTLVKLLGDRGDAIVTRVTDWLGVASGNSVHSVNSVQGWGDPVPLSVSPVVPDFPVEVFPPWLRAWVAAVATELQVPPDLPAGIGLGLVGGGIGRKVVVSPRPGFVEPTNPYVMCALPPGDRKTQTFKKALLPVLELERELREAAAPGILAATSEQRIAEKRMKHLEDKIAKAEPADREALQEQLREAREEFAGSVVPAEPLLYTEDDTPEALKHELIVQGGRMMVATTEAKCLENITLYADRPNFDVYLKGHAGDELRSGRVGRGRESITDPALTCVLAPQPEVLRGLAENDVLRGRGFLARWFYQLPVSKVGSRTVGAPAVPGHVQQGYHDKIKSAWQLGSVPDGCRSEEQPRVLTFDPAARAVFEAFERWLEPQLAPGAALARLAGWANKLNGACARLAAALHVADALGEGADWPETIPAGAVERAVVLCRDYYIPHAVAAFDLMGANRALTGARRVWAWVGAVGVSTFSKRDAMQGNRAAFETVDDLQPCLDLLERHHLIRPQTLPERKGPGRPSSPVYEVNPNAPPDAPAAECAGHERPDTLAQNSQNAQNCPAPAPARGSDRSHTPAQNSQNTQNSDPPPPGGNSVHSVNSVQGYAAGDPHSTGRVPASSPCAPPASLFSTESTVDAAPDTGSGEEYPFEELL